jgi:Holliday junction resolvasome RuvABC endonuclease subunit
MIGRMAIDPGLRGTGVAIWQGKGPVPKLTQVITSKGAESKDWIDRVNRIAIQVADLCDEYHVRIIISEFMEMHQSARAQMMWKAGDFQRTLFLIGAIYGMVEAFTPTFEVVPPSTWKGQLPKSVTINRVRKIIGARACRELGIETHAWDAVGIGLWHMRYLK